MISDKKIPGFHTGIFIDGNRLKVRIKSAVSFSKINFGLGKLRTFRGGIFEVQNLFW
ncbi:hypothetical protein BGP_6135 [Beggiatoa sp. PS]|nr:hypothetical protein BGP_6135 [Beggiatoa sp. PS]